MLISNFKRGGTFLVLYNGKEIKLRIIFSIFNDEHSYFLFNFSL